MMKAYLLKPGLDTYAIMSRLLLLPHVLPVLDGRLVGYLAAWKLFHEIEAGDCLVFGVTDGTGRAVGAAFGYIEAETFYTHLIFERHTDAKAGSNAAINALTDAYPELERIAAEVPERNRAVRLLMHKLGFKATGQEGRPYLDQSGEWLPTQLYICQLMEA